MRVCLGGTFNHFHKGHKKLIDKAIQKAESNGFVFIGLSSGPLIEHKSSMQCYDTRRKQILSYIKNKNEDLPTIVIESIETVEGPTLDVDFDAIVVSEETKKTAEKINHKRMEKGLKPMEIVSIPLVLAEDNEKISSTRISHHEIDEEGHLI
jgi:pantetheine-phosphate adenylyltransferase